MVVCPSVFGLTTGILCHSGYGNRDRFQPSWTLNRIELLKIVDGNPSL